MSEISSDIAHQVTLENWVQSPYNRWGFRNAQRLIPTAEISRGAGPVFSTKENLQSLGAIEFSKYDGDHSTVAAFLDESFTDGILVLHRGEVAYEEFRDGFTGEDHHIIFSITKSFVGMLAGIFIHQGLFGRDDSVSAIIPELRTSGWGGATVAHVLDMTSGTDFIEDYEDRASSYWALRRVLYHLVDDSDEHHFESVLDFLPTVGSGGPHGESFTYRSADTLVLAWIIERTTGRQLAELIETEIWSKLGAEQDAYIMLDPKGVAYGSGGLCTTLRDLARFGFMVANGGALNGVQVVPEEWIKQSRTGNKSAFRRSVLADRFPNGAYRNQWWIKDVELGVPLALGIHGQMIYIDRAKDMVGVKLSSWPAARLTETLHDTISAFEAIAKNL